MLINQDRQQPVLISTYSTFVKTEWLDETLDKEKFILEHPYNIMVSSQLGVLAVQDCALQFLDAARVAVPLTPRYHSR